MSDLVTLAVGLSMLAGIAGVVFPAFPGLPVVWGAALGYGILSGFGVVGWAAFAVITALFVAGMAAGIVLPKRRLDATGAPRSTAVAGLLGAIIGFFVIPVAGLPLGAVAGVMLAERRRGTDWAQGWATTRQLAIGFGLGAVAQLLAGLLMFGCWLGWVFLR